MPNPAVELTLQEAVAQILAVFDDRLGSAIKGDTGLLKNVETFTIGARLAIAADPPLLWVVPGEMLADSERATMGRTETWVWPLDLVGMVRDEDPVAGLLAAIDIAARARSIMVGHSADARRLGLDFVQSIASRSLSPIDPPPVQGNRLTHAVTASVVVTFWCREMAAPPALD